MASTELMTRARAALVDLGADPKLISRRQLPLFADAHELVVADVSASGREHRLAPRAAACWRLLRDQAGQDGVRLIMISGFRSFERQLELIRRRIATGEAIGAALTVLAPAGCSEHHTGRAIDIGTPGCEPLSESFEATAAFSWLSAHAEGHGFRMSYPRGNPWGYCYEPWHWCWSSNNTLLGDLQ